MFIHGQQSKRSVGHIAPPKDIRHPHGKITKLNEIYQFDLLSVLQNNFKGSRYKYILKRVLTLHKIKDTKTGYDIENERSDISTGDNVLKEGGVLKYPEIFQSDKNPKEVIKMQNVELVNSEECPEEKLLSQNGLYSQPYQPNE